MGNPKEHMMPIIVTGIQRSGSSIIATILKNGGVFTGVVNRMCENKQIKSILNSEYKKNRLDIKGQFPIPFGNININETIVKDRIQNVLKYEGYKSGHWLIKSSRFLQTYRNWKRIYPQAQWVIVKRKPSDVIQSCLKTDYMCAFNSSQVLDIVQARTIEKGWLWWIQQQDRLITELVMSEANTFVVWPERMVDGDFGQMEELFARLQLSFERTEVQKYISRVFKNSPQNKL